MMMILAVKPTRHEYIDALNNLWDLAAIKVLISLLCEKDGITDDNDAIDRGYDYDYNENSHDNDGAEIKVIVMIMYMITIAIVVTAVVVIKLLNILMKIMIKDMVIFTITTVMMMMTTMMMSMIILMMIIVTLMKIAMPLTSLDIQHPVGR